MAITVLDRYVQQANLLREDCARIARQIEETAQAVDDARRAPMELSIRIKEIKDNIVMITTNIEAEVGLETVDAITATPKFKTVDARKAESARRVRADVEINTYNSQLRALESQKMDADIKLGSAETLLKAYTGVQALKGQEAELLAATIRALAPNSIGEQALGEIEQHVISRLSASIKTGPIRQLIIDAAKG